MLLSTSASRAFGTLVTVETSDVTGDPLRFDADFAQHAGWRDSTTRERPNSTHSGL